MHLTRITYVRNNHPDLDTERSLASGKVPSWTFLVGTDTPPPLLPSSHPLGYNASHLFPTSFTRTLPKGDHTVGSLLCLASFAQHDSFQVHRVPHMYQ